MKVRAVLLLPALVLALAGRVRAQNPDSAPPPAVPPANSAPAAPAPADSDSTAGRSGAAQPAAPPAGTPAPRTANPQGAVQIEDVGAPGASAAPAAPPDTTAGAPTGVAAPIPAGATPAPGVATPTAPAQPSAPRPPLRDTTFVVDRVVAVVGNHPILASQVDEEIFARQSQGLKPPSSPEELAAVRKTVLQSIIDDELLVQEAERDTTIKVTDQEIAEGVEEQIKKIRGNFNSEIEYAAELKKAGFETPDEYRRWLTDQQRRAALQNRLIEERRGSGKLKPVIPTEREMKEFFDEQKGSLEKRPATLSFRQIVVAPRPSAEERQRAYQLADSIAIALRGGGDFAVAAKRFSMDSASRELGGSLNWFRRGTMVPEFERVAFALKPGVISDPVETPFGFHVIQVERSQPGEVQARHILIMPEITEQESDSAHRLAESVYQAAKAGASFDSLQTLYHDKPEEREGRDVPVTKLPATYAKAIGNAPEGAVVPPFALEGMGGRTKWAVVRVTSRRPEGDVRYEDVRDKIRQQLGDQLAVRRFIDQLRKKAYVDVRS